MSQYQLPVVSCLCMKANNNHLDKNEYSVVLTTDN
jgi:hypothetical protein